MSDGLEPTVDTTGTPAPEITPSIPESAPPDSGGHPAWQEALSQVPVPFHDRLTPVFSKWDQEVQKKIEAEQSRYAPYRSFIESRVDPAQIDASLRLAQALQTDPRAVYDYLAEQHGYNTPTSGQGRGATGDTVDLGEFADEQKPVDDPRFNQLERQQQLLMQTMQHQMEQESQREGDVWLSGKQAEITAKYPNLPLDWDYIINKAAVDGQRTRDFDKALESAAGAYVKLLGNMRANPGANGTAPNVLPATGGVPATNVKVSEMTDKARKQFALDMLTALDRE